MKDEVRVVDDSSPPKKKTIRDIATSINNSQFYKYSRILNMKKKKYKHRYEVS